jgi:linoleoyl-CoA desaturase
MLALYLVPYGLMVSGIFENPWLVQSMWLIMGVGVAGIGLSIMHDANHGAFSDKPFVNRLMGYSLNLIGGNALNWRIQHNVLHHTFTNIDGKDEDISRAVIVRMHPNQKLKGMHRFQYIYAWLLYGIMTLSWVFAKEIPQLIDYHKRGLVKKSEGSLSWLVTQLIISKILYFAYMLVIPIMVLPTPWWATLLGFFSMHFIAGVILGAIFQPAHVNHQVEFPEPDENGNVDNNWAIHQLQTTTNFAPSNRLLSWFVGGLNYQVEHHLFPNISHIHYRNIAPIVQKTAKEFGLPYHSNPSFLSAVWEHAKTLYYFGRANAA